MIVLQMADIHGQLDIHNKSFGERQAVFHRIGGPARIMLLVEEVCKENPEGAFLVDAGTASRAAGLAEGSTASWPDLPGKIE